MWGLLRLGGLGPLLGTGVHTSPYAKNPPVLHRGLGFKGRGGPQPDVQANSC